jgi:signal peptidase II
MTAVIIIIIALVGLDQATKWAAHRFITPDHPVAVFPFMHLVNVRNEGAAFGILQRLGNPFFIAISGVAIIVIFIMLLRGKNKSFGLVLILSGAIGNFIDRIALGYVRDFADFFAGRYHWPAFNFADAYLTIGIFVLLYETLRARNKIKTLL